jgi:WD40 repeat protein
MLACGAIWLTASASAATSISANWAGYASVPAASVGSRFSSVSGSWTLPSATCTSGKEAYSAVWVGLGGYSKSAALEQVGADADCTRSGHASYSTWYELLPAGPVNVALKVHPGDRMSASVTVRSRDVTLRLRNLSTGARFTTTRRVAKIDVSSAEWIVEAPSVCATAGSCATLPLTNFGTTLFSSATATARGHTGTIDDADWSAIALELQQAGAGATGGGPAALRRASARALTVATASAVAASDGSFSVVWGERSIHTEQPAAPTFPGLNGGPP